MFTTPEEFNRNPSRTTPTALLLMASSPDATHLFGIDQTPSFDTTDLLCIDKILAETDWSKASTLQI